MGGTPEDSWRRLIRRAWRHLAASSSGRLDRRADRRTDRRTDPRVQLDQAIGHAQAQHQRLREQAATVIANQRQTELRLNRVQAEIEKVEGSARQALLMAQDAERAGRTARAAELTEAAEAFANRMVALEQEAADLRTLHLHATDASDQAKAAVQQHSLTMQRHLAERERLLHALDQAEMAEQLNQAMGVLSETAGADVPSLDQVRARIEERYARATGTAEVAALSTAHRMLEVEHELRAVEARERLTRIRSDLGITPGETRR